MGRRTGEALREAILEEAFRRVREEGSEAVSMRRLGRHLGYAPATIYLYFEGKQELLAEVAEEGFRRLLARSLAALDKPDPARALEEGARAWVAFALEEPHLYRLMVPGVRPPSGEGAAARLWARWRDLYARVAPGCGGAADPETRVRLAWSLLHGLVTLALAPAPPPPG
ncbi:MAG: TetR/AcrR family transcriptional regulator, partial [Myxococcota bacterium]|nr:TetR/AcrR family transcriptional regulator [Myxococcota bacterium]